MNNPDHTQHTSQGGWQISTIIILTVIIPTHCLRKVSLSLSPPHFLLLYLASVQSGPHLTNYVDWVNQVFSRQSFTLDNRCFQSPISSCKRCLRTAWPFCNPLKSQHFPHESGVPPYPNTHSCDVGLVSRKCLVISQQCFLTNPNATLPSLQTHLPQRISASLPFCCFCTECVGPARGWWWCSHGCICVSGYISACTLVWYFSLCVCVCVCPLHSNSP